jgi:hypothetical protein
MNRKLIKFNNLIFALQKIHIEQEVINTYKKELVKLIQELATSVETDGSVWLPEEYDQFYIEHDMDNILHVDNIHIILHREMLTDAKFLERYDANEERENERIEETMDLSYDGLNFI